MASRVGSGPADRAISARLGAGAVALAWAVVFFGVIDLSMTFDPSESPGSNPFVVLATSWGLLYTVLLPVPLIAWAVRPVHG